MEESLTIVDKKMSYNNEFLAVLQKECTLTDRKKDVTQDLKEFFPESGSFKAPIRKIECTGGANCKEIKTWTDMKESMGLIDNTKEKKQYKLGRECLECHCGKDDLSDFRGTFNRPEADTCQNWRTFYKEIVDDNPNAGLDSNYCRNPDGEDRAWCYTGRTGCCVRNWQWCDIPRCEDDKFRDKKRHVCGNNMLAVKLENHPHDHTVRTLTCAHIKDGVGLKVLNDNDLDGDEKALVENLSSISSGQNNSEQSKCPDFDNGIISLVAGVECDKDPLKDKASCTRFKIICRKVKVREIMNLAFRIFIY